VLSPKFFLTSLVCSPQLSFFTFLLADNKSVRYQILTAANMEMNIFWDVAPCCLVNVYRRFSGAVCSHRPDD
jgi:hypothetical protein